MRVARGAMALALAAATQLGGSLHYVLVEHVRCAEHGELTHGSDADAFAPRDEPRPVDAIEGTTARDPDGAHEHCLVAVERRKATLAAAALTPIDAPTLLATHLLAAAESAPRPPLDAAPKTSPPA